MRIAVHIQAGCEIHIHAKSPKLGRRDQTRVVSRLLITCCGDRHGRRDVCAVAREPGNHATLLVDRDKGGVTALMLHQFLNIKTQLVQLFLACNVAREENYIADFVAPHSLNEGVVHSSSLKPADKVLADHNPSLNSHIVQISSSRS